MTEYQDTSGLFDRLIVLNREALDAEYYTTAYHTLATALHAAYLYEDAEGCATVERLAREQLVVIDRTAPAYEYSTQSAQTRGHQSFFLRLTRQAHVLFLILADDPA